MTQLTILEPIDYLMIGHITVDETPQGLRLGGAAAYSAMTARALGLRVGIVTTWAEEISSEDLQGIQVVNYQADKSTRFLNRYTSTGREQILHSLAPKLDFYHIPPAWRDAGIVHLGPVAQEVEPAMVRNFPSAFLGITPQGWLRNWDQDGLVYPGEWPEADFVLQRADAIVLSTEDVGGEESRIEEMIASAQVIAVTEAKQGVRLYWHGDVRRFRPPVVDELDATGAGDIFAAAFFVRLQTTRDPWEAARFATQLSAFSVTRSGLQGVPTMEEINQTIVEII
jgi:sugar/nucleoside kinase (ribokinase family)